MTSGKLISAMDAAERLGVHHDTLYRRWREWGLPGIYVGRSLKFRERDIESWLARQEDASR
jgi:excisionase family DNA binding protein